MHFADVLAVPTSAVTLRAGCFWNLAGGTGNHAEVPALICRCSRMFSSTLLEGEDSKLPGLGTHDTTVWMVQAAVLHVAEKSTSSWHLLALLATSNLPG